MKIPLCCPQCGGEDITEAATMMVYIEVKAWEVDADGDLSAADYGEHHDDCDSLRQSVQEDCYWCVLCNGPIDTSQLDQLAQLLTANPPRTP